MKYEEYIQELESWMVILVTFHPDGLQSEAYSSHTAKETAESTAKSAASGHRSCREKCSLYKW